MTSIPLDLQKSANGGGPPDFCERIRPRPKSQNLKVSNSRPSPTRAKEKPTGLSQGASGLHQRCERGTQALGIFHVAADILFCRANCCFVGLDSGNRAAGESLAAHRAGPKPFPAASVSKKTPARG